MTKIWDPYGALKCSRCNRPASDGFLWRCTTETNGNLPSSDFSNFPADHTITTFIPSSTTMSQSYENLDQDVRAFIEQGDYTIEEKNTLPELKPWMLRAIADGQYTHDHVKLFTEQKNNVPRTIRTQLGVQERPDTSSSSLRPDTSSTIAGSDNSQNTAITIANQPLVQATDEAIDQYYWSEAHRAWHSSTHRLRQQHDLRLPPPVRNLLRFDPVSGPPDAQVRAQVNLPAPGPVTSQPAPSTVTVRMPCCDYQACSRCRSLSQTRGMPSIDQVLADADAGMMPPLEELMNRPIADARVVAVLGLRQAASAIPSSASSEVDGWEGYFSALAPAVAREEGGVEEEEMGGEGGEVGKGGEAVAVEVEEEIAAPVRSRRRRVRAALRRLFGRE
jgi:hypothetical protein